MKINFFIQLIKNILYPYSILEYYYYIIIYNLIIIIYNNTGILKLLYIKSIFLIDFLTIFSIEKMSILQSKLFESSLRNEFILTKKNSFRIENKLRF